MTPRSVERRRGSAGTMAADAASKVRHGRSTGAQERDRVAVAEPQIRAEEEANMERRRQAHRPTGRLRLTGGLLVLAVLCLLVSCAESVGHSPEVPTRYQDRETGAARLMADATPRIDGIVEVTNRFPDPDEEVVGAAVLIDHVVGTRLPRKDFRGRPLFVEYVDKRAAARAVAARRPGSYLRNGLKVIYLPAGFPLRAVEAYQRGLGAALQ